MKPFNLTSSVTKLINIDSSMYTHNLITYNQDSFDSFDIVFYMRKKYVSLPNPKVFSNDEYNVKLSLTCAKNLKASVKFNTSSNISVANLKSKLRNLFEPENPQIGTIFKIGRDSSNYEIGLYFLIQYKDAVDISDFKQKISEMFPTMIITYVDNVHGDSSYVRGFMYPSKNDIEPYKPIQYGLKDISEKIVNKVFLKLATDTKYQIINLLSNYAAKHNKELLTIHSDLGINQLELLELLNVEKMAITYDLLHKIASMNNKQVSIQII